MAGWWLDEINENYKLIDKFMELGVDIYGGGMDRKHVWVNKDNHHVFECRDRYGAWHSSYDWIFAVIDKIEKLGYYWVSDPWSHTIIEALSGEEKQIVQFSRDHAFDKVYTYYYAAVGFIKWYNEPIEKTGREPGPDGK